MSEDLRRVSVNAIKIEHRLHKPVSERRVSNLILNWDNRLAGRLTVSERDGELWLVDGQHRLAALKAMGIRRAQVVVIPGLTVEDEARLFNRLNDQRWRRLSKKDIARARAFAEGGA